MLRIGDRSSDASHLPKTRKPNGACTRRALTTQVYFWTTHFLWAGQKLHFLNVLALVQQVQLCNLTSFPFLLLAVFLFFLSFPSCSFAFSKFLGDPHAVRTWPLPHVKRPHADYVEQTTSIRMKKVSQCQLQKSEVMCFNSYTSNLPPLFYDGACKVRLDGHRCECLPCRWGTRNVAALRPFTAGNFWIKQFI